MFIFKAYTYGSGTPIATGGRYDKLLSQFGKDAPSIGFGIYVDELLMAMSRQQIDIDTDYLGTILLYERSQKDLAIRLANVLRADSSVTLMKKQLMTTLRMRREAVLVVSFILMSKENMLRL